MSKLEIRPIHEPPSPVARVLFVHGLDGDAAGTWTTPGFEPASSGFWPAWLAEAFPSVAIHSIGYPNAASGWRGHAFALPDRAASVLHLLSVKGLLDRPMVFVVHSMGGLVLKQMLDSARDDANLATLRELVRGIVFLATPQTGSALASMLAKLPIALPSAAITTLVADEPNTRALQQKFRSWHEERTAAGMAPVVSVMYEMLATALVRVVAPGRADPGLAGVKPIPVDADHLSIATPCCTDDSVYLEVQRVVASVAALEAVKVVRAAPKGCGDRPRPYVALAAATGALAILVLGGFTAHRYWPRPCAPYTYSVQPAAGATSEHCDVPMAWYVSLRMPAGGAADGAQAIALSGVAGPSAVEIQSEGCGTLEEPATIQLWECPTEPGTTTIGFVVAACGVSPDVPFGRAVVLKAETAAEGLRSLEMCE